MLTITRVLFLAVAFVITAIISLEAQPACRRDTPSSIPVADTLTCLSIQTPTPEPTSPVRGRVPAAFVTAGRDDSDVQLQLGWTLAPGRNWQHSLGATATAPLGDRSLSPLAELRGALPGTALEVSLNGLRWPSATGRTALAWCEQMKVAERIRADEDCDDLTESGVEENYPHLLRAYHRATGWGTPIAYQLTASASYDQHEFLDGATLKAESQTHIPFTLSGTFGGFVGQTLFTLNARYERRFEDGVDVQICTPAGVGTAESCKTSPLGEPESGFNTVITGQARRFFSQNVGLNLRASYRMDDEAWSVEAPFYFIPDGDGALIGGIVPGWSSEEDEFTIHLFVGRAFGLRL